MRPRAALQIPESTAARIRLPLCGLASVLLAFAGMAAVVFPVAAATVVQNLHRASVPSAGQTDAARNAAFAAALRIVAVRASGQRDAGERLSPATLADARRLVQQFGANPDGTLNVGFDATAVDRVLAQNDLPVWGSERPVVLVWLTIDELSGPPAWVGLDGSPPEIRVLQQVAELRGLPLVWPLMDAEDRTLASVVGDDSAAAPRLASLAARYRADAVLVGRGRRGSQGEVAIRWNLHFGESSTLVNGSLPEGVHHAADYFASLFAAGPGPARDIVVEVGAIGDLKAYAETLNYLEGLTLVRSTAVEHVAGDKVRFRLQVTGDAALLARTIRLGSRLVPDTSENALAAPDRLLFRYQPFGQP